MSKIAGAILCAAVTMAPALSQAEESKPPTSPPPPAQGAPSSELSCHDKAHAVYSDADWKKTKEPNMECVKQGLYSKCFATAIPCGTTKASAP